MLKGAVEIVYDKVILQPITDWPKDSLARLQQSEHHRSPTTLTARFFANLPFDAT